MDIRTDDGCIHYMDIQTNEIYSYEFFSNSWLKQYQSSLKELFN